jgi:hypothetical protein
MAFLTVLLLVGSAVRLVVLVMRPSPRRRFHQPRRRLLARRLEQLGDTVVILTALWMIFFGYGHHRGIGLMLLWGVLFIAGFGTALSAHYLAGRHRLVPARPVDGNRPSRSRSVR